jgi:hypothetical protein
LYRSGLIFFSGKILSKWEGLFIIEEVYRSGAIKHASLKDNTTQVVNGQRLKHYFSGDYYNEYIDIIQVVTRFLSNSFSKKKFALSFPGYVFVVFAKYEKLRGENGYEKVPRGTKPPLGAGQLQVAPRHGLGTLEPLSDPVSPSSLPFVTKLFAI